MKRIAVVGGGIAGLAAAHRLHADAPDLDLVLFERSSRLGGKIRTSPFMGRPIDEAPDAFLTRVPWALELCEELGIADRYVSPASSSAYVVVGGRLRRLPAGLVLGVPTRFWPLLRSRIVTPAAALRVGLDRVKGDDWPGGDESVGNLIRRRVGDQVAERLVGPLVGSINAGDTDHLDAQLVTPQFATAARRHRSLISGLKAQTRQANLQDQPVFHSFEGGMGHLVEVLTERLRRVDMRTGVAVQAVRSTGDGLAVDHAGGTATPFDAVIIGAPADAASQLLAEGSPGAAEQLDSIEYASVAMVTMGFRRSEVGHPLDGSGMLVPPNEGMLTTAASWASTKWPHWADDEHVVLRVSAGRAGDERAMALDDDALVGALLGEVARLLDIRGELLEWRVSRWPNSFPQYAPGHERRVTEIESQLRRDLPGVFVTGAAYRGLGIPACIRQGTEAARATLDHLGLS